MTYSPLIIGLASIIPGLGFWLLGQRQRSISIGLIGLGLILSSLLFFENPIGQFSVYFFQIGWVAQLIFAVQISRAKRKQTNDESQIPNPSDNFLKSAAQKPPKMEASEYYSQELARAQLQDGEQIIKSFIGQKHTPSYLSVLTGPVTFFAASWHCIVLTNQSTLLLIELDLLWKPLNVKRIPCSDIVSARYKTSWLSTDKLSLDFGNGKPLELDVPHTFRKPAQTIVSVFEKQQPVKQSGG